jgi:hypothetical protein
VWRITKILQEGRKNLVLNSNEVNILKSLIKNDIDLEDLNNRLEWNIPHKIRTSNYEKIALKWLLDNNEKELNHNEIKILRYLLRISNKIVIK